MFAFQDRQGSVEVAFTDRRGGVSSGPYRSLNLASHSDDDDDAVARNLSLVTEAFCSGRALRATVGMHQQHGCTVHVVDEDVLREVETGEPVSPSPRGDGLVTAAPGVALMVRVADCVPVLLADPVTGVVGAAHAGRPGLVAGVVPATVRAMRELGAVAVRAWMGPHVCGACYEVPARMRCEVSAVVPAAHAESSWGTPALDIGAGVRTQLAEAGVDVVDTGRCTREDEDLYSYRRQGQRSGRTAGLVWTSP